MTTFYILNGLNQALLFKRLFTTCLSFYFFYLLGISVPTKSSTKYVLLYFLCSFNSLCISLRISPCNTVQNALMHFQRICCSGFKLSLTLSWIKSQIQDKAFAFQHFPRDLLNPGSLNIPKYWLYLTVC